MKNIVVALLATVVSVSPAFGVTKEPLRFGVFPFLPANQLEIQVGPLLKSFSEHLQRPVEFKTRGSFEDYLQALKDKRFDIALIQPFDYIHIREQRYYRPLVRKQDSMQAWIMTADSNIKQLQDLRGKKIAFPSKTAAVTLLALRDLQLAGITEQDFQPHFFNEHQSCIISAINGLSDACVTVNGNAVDLVAGTRIKILQTTLRIPHILIVIHPEAVEDLENLQAWFLSLNEKEDGQRLLESAFLQRLTPATDQDYKVVEEVYQQTLEASVFLSKY